MVARVVIIALATFFLVICEVKADFRLVGRAEDRVILTTKSGKIDVSFSKLRELLMVNSRISSFTAYQTSVENLFVQNSNIRALEASSSSFVRSNWKSVVVSQAVFRDTDFREALVIGSSISHCSFERADLRGAVFVDTLLYDCSFQKALYDDSTRLPFDPRDPEKGMTYAP